MTTTSRRPPSVRTVGAGAATPVLWGAAGFTLIELLAVIGVIVVITSIIVGNAFGVTRGATFTSAREIPFNVLQYARQRACMDGRETIAYFSNRGDEKSVGVFQIAGTLTQNAESESIVDRYSSIAEMTAAQSAGTLKVFNFTRGDKPVSVREIERLDDAGTIKFLDGDAAADGAQNEYKYPYAKITLKPKKEEGETFSGWQAGDAYGFEISERMRLPKDFAFTSNDSEHVKEDDFWVIFHPDGSSSSATITIFEAKVKNGKRVTIMVTNGEIRQGEAGS